MQDFLTKEDWVKVKQLVKILKPFILATKHIEGNANSYGVKGLYRALQELIINIELLYQVLIQTQQNLRNVDNCFLKSSVNIALQKLNKYFNKIKAKSPYYFIAVILYPSLKRAYFYNKWKQQLQQQKHAKRCMEIVFNNYINKQVGKEDKEVVKL